MQKPTLLDEKQWLDRIKKIRSQAMNPPYRAMYSTWWDGIVTNPAMMLLPIDDHMVHRGDAVFEALRVVRGAIFDLKGHLRRLQFSAQSISLLLPMSLEDIIKCCLHTVAATQLQEAMIRLYVSRGPGSFTPHPYESVGSQLYIVVTDFKPVRQEAYEKGVRAIVSRVPQKEPFYARIKSCNYLPNVLMKKEAADHGVDFSLGCDEQGRILEGATENMAIVSGDHRLLIPSFEHILRGTMLDVAMKSVEQTPLHSIGGQFFEKNLMIQDLKEAQEVFMVGTTFEILPVVEIDGKAVGAGRPGPVAQELKGRIQEALLGVNPDLRTPIPFLKEDL